MTNDPRNQVKDYNQNKNLVYKSLSEVPPMLYTIIFQRGIEYVKAGRTYPRHVVPIIGVPFHLYIIIFHLGMKWIESQPHMVSKSPRS